MKTLYTSHPSDFKTYNTNEIREHFLLENLFVEDGITNFYSHYDRMIVGGVKPVTKSVKLETLSELKTDFYLDRRELGIINVGNTGSVRVDGVSYVLKNKEALYVAKDSKEVIFENTPGGDSLFYFNSAPAHHVYPTCKVTSEEAEIVEMGSLESANHRNINKLIVNSVVQTCQLQMGLTELRAGSVWNTMPAHTHSRRMEVYFYFNLKEEDVVCHFLGEPSETRHIWMKNNQAVLSPPWSIHSGVGTSNYSFIWGMAGENLDYNDMDRVKPGEMK